MKPPAIPYARTLQYVRSDADFRAFAFKIGLLLLFGRSLLAMRMLQAVGADAKLAYEITDGWPLTEADRGCPRDLMTLQEEAACRFSFFIDGANRVDWAEALRVAGNGR